MDKLDTYDSKSYTLFTSKMEYDKAINTLAGLMDGMTADNITINEIEELQFWLQMVKPFSDKKPFDELIPLINHALSDNHLDQEEIDDIVWLCSKFKVGEGYYDLITVGIQMLNGYIHGIMADNVLSVQEVVNLKKWLELHDDLAGYFPYDEIYSLLTSILKDGVVTDDELTYLKAFLSQFIDTKRSMHLSENHFSELRKNLSVDGICAMQPEVEFDGHKFCFTGQSVRKTRRELEEIIYKLNGSFSNNVTKDTSYLIVGAGGNDCWAFSCYGRKVEQAVSLRKKGARVIIVHENDFWDAVEDAGGF